MRVLVTGGAGFIGSNFVRMFAQGLFPEISHVTVLDKLTYAGNSHNLEEVKKFENFRFISGDICDAKLVSKILKETDAVINFAAESHVDRSIISAAEFVETNIVGVQILLDACKTVNHKIRFVQISTDEVYGSIEIGASEESWPMRPSSPYAASKAGGELLALSYFKTHGLDVVVTRCSNNYGPYHFPEKLIPLFITNILEGKTIPIYGTGENIRDWLHVDDHCRGVYAVLNKGQKGQIYNIGGGRELSNLEVASLIISELGADKTAIEFVEDRKGHDLRYSVDWSKIKNELEYLPRVTFERGLAQTVAWYKANGSWWKSLKGRA